MNNFVQRIWQRDTSLWTQDPQVAQTIDNRLGWLDCVSTFEPKLTAIRAFTDFLPYSFIVLLGMGGSSLVSNVFHQALANKQRKFFVLETTDPATILSVQNQIKLEDTLFIVASKSGSTIEVSSLFQYFFKLCPRPEQFIAITDFNTPLMHLAEKNKFRHTFINPSDIGGRFAALSYFGLIPFALMGGDVISFSECGKKIVEECKKEKNNPALDVAKVLFDNHQAGKNKLHFNITPGYTLLGTWIEQLVAESTGKHGHGVIPILQGKPNEDGYTVDIRVDNPFALAKEFFSWEMTTALLGAMLELNPFDEPNVVSSKKNTQNFLQGSNPKAEVADKIQERVRPLSEIDELMSDIKSPEFAASLSYTKDAKTVEENLKKLPVSSTLCQGPSYLHSTGQLHKGGPNQGRFVIVVDDQEDLPIPGQNYGFQTLKLAQALGDYDALKAADRKVMMVNLVPTSKDTIGSGGGT